MTSHYGSASFFLVFPSLTGSSSGIWLNCFIHGLTLPSACFLPSLVFSSKDPGLQFLTPRLRSPLTAVGCRLLGLMGDGGSSGLHFKEGVFSPRSCPFQCFQGLGQVTCSHFAAVSRGVFGASLPWRRRFFPSTNRRPGVDSQAVVPTVGFGMPSEMLKGRYLHVS